MNLIILTEQDRTGESRFRLDDSRLVHIRTVLKLKPGDNLEVGLLDGPVASARVLSIGDKETVLEVNSWQEPSAGTPDTTLICALPRPQTLKKVLITCAMMGVRRLDLIRANRVEKSYFSSPMLESENQLPFLIEGLAQGKRTRLPEVHVHDRFRRFFEDVLDTTFRPTADSLRLLCEPETKHRLPDLADGRHSRVLLAIGPEGGWVPFEIELMESRGFVPFSLGSWILRVEHAVVAALAQLELCR